MCAATRHSSFYQSCDKRLRALGAAGGMSASLLAGNDLAKFLQRLPGGCAGAKRANSSTEGRGHTQAGLLQGRREGGCYWPL